jgi:hypothetical protein
MFIKILSFLILCFLILFLYGDFKKVKKQLFLTKKQINKKK